MGVEDPEEGSKQKEETEDLLASMEVQEGEKTKQYLAAIATTLGSFGIGTAVAWTSPTLPFLASTDFLGAPIDKHTEAWIGSLIAIGAMIGAIPTGYIADSIGRKWTIIGLSVPFILSWGLIIFGRSVWLLYLARLLAGFSTGGISVVSPMYIGEIAEVSIRGALGNYFELLMCIGVATVYAVGAFVSYIWLAVIMGIFPIISLIIFLFMPETPTYLLKRGKPAEAKAVLQYFRGVNCCVDPELKILTREVEMAEANAASFKDLISSRVTIKALVIGVGLQVVQQMSGVNVVIFYTADVFKDAGSTLDPNLCAVIMGVVQAVMNYVSLVLVDRAGRRVLLLASGSVSCICLIALGAYFYIKTTNEELAVTLQFIPLTAVNIFIMAIALGYGPIPWMMLGEIFSSSFKGPATSICAVTNWGLVFFVTKTYADFVSIVDIAGAFWFYAICSFLGILFVFFCVPETKGKTFLEIQNSLAGK